MMPFPACASNQKNRTFGSKNGDRSAKKATGHSAESENVPFIVDLRNCECDRPCKTRDGARGTAHRTGVRARGIGRESLYRRSRSRAFSSSSMILDHCLLSNCSESFPKRVLASHPRKNITRSQPLIAD